ncbi:peptidoglycan DD-metalloendopeptidase family protein [Candidatus Kaiserbacteria bacterium]|nr:peptidoglycan DD-metalloendopeptidase family protein [Candidatus Kaiserbacteria bacterium]
MRRILTFSLIAVCFLYVPFSAFAQSVEELQKQIDQNNTQIDQLNKEIAQYEAQLKTTTTQKNTLQNKINQLDLQKKKLQSSIAVTQKQISTTQAQISTLGHTIESTQATIDKDTEALKQSFRLLVETESQPLAFAVLSSETFTSIWEDADAQAQIQQAVRDKITVLNTEKQELTDSKTAAEKKHELLLTQQKTLTTQQGSLSATRQSQAELLSQTKAQEANYQKILAQKKAQEAAFEDALNDLQAKLNYTVAPSEITKAGKGVLHYPLDNVRITQYFGNTDFAKSGAYAGKGHNGMDFAASIGTPIKAALSGVILGTGNTDAVKGCYSFGKWVMIQHSNGLNTMYAHLSQISVTKGQTVATGELLGYSGETGYATGPHLHFGVYVSSATQIMTLGAATQTKTPCANATMPIAPLTGYLNPLSYL